jgi:hypothetical protein
MKSPLLLVWALLSLMTPAGLIGAEDWRPLFNGRDLAGWSTFMARPDPAWDVPGLQRGADGKYLEPIGPNRDPLHVFVVESVDGHPAVHISGQGFGVMTTKESFANVHFRMEFKWGEKKWGYKLNARRDCGLLYLVHGEDGAVHNTWPRAIEFQIQEHDTGDLWALGAQTTVTARPETVANGRTLYHFDPAAAPVLFVEQPPVGNRCIRLADAERPHGEWNVLDLIVLGGDSIHIVNGRVVMRLRGAQRLDGTAPAPLTAGAISLQTEGAEVFYRNMMIRPITTVPAEFAEKQN